jgi:hypothetical protein
MKSFIQFLEPLNKWLWSFLCKRHLILFCGGGSDINMPPPIDPGEAMGEYLFGSRFAKDYRGITDPRLQEKLISAESAYRPRYTALELQDIATMAYGIEAGTPNQERLRLEAELAGLQAGAEVDATIDYEALERSLEAQYTSAAGPMKATRGRGGQGSRTRYKSAQGSYVRSGIESAKLAAQLSDKERAAKIAQLEAQIEQMPETVGGQKGLFQMLEDQSRMAGDLQREQLGLQRESDVAALREYAPQVVEAYREADPRSAALADLAQQQAETLYAEAEGPLSPERRRIAEQSARQASLARGRIGDESSIAAEVLGREQFRSGLRAEARQACRGSSGWCWCIRPATSNGW